MSEFTAEQKARQNAMSRKQLAIEAQMIAEGMSPPEAELAAARAVLAERRGEVEASLPRDAQGRVQLSPQEAAFDNDMALAMGQVAYGNGAEVDNLAAAATPIQMDREFGDDPTMGMAGMVAAREQAAAEDWERRGEIYGPQTEAYVEQYGQTWGPDAQPLTPEQKQARSDRRDSESKSRHNPRAEEARIRRMADRAGISYADAEAMVNQGYESAGEARGMHPDSRFKVGGKNDTVPPNFDYFSESYKPLRQAIGDRRAADKAERQQAVIRRAQAQYNPMEYLNRDDVNDWQRMVTANRLLGSRGYRGATPLDVDQAAQTALALREQRLATGEGFQPRTPEERKILEDRAAAEQRENDPGTAGLRDVQGGRFETKEARQLLKDIAKPFDTNWLGGASEDAFPQIKQRLMDPPYSLPEAQADIAAREAMRQTNWW